MKFEKGDKVLVTYEGRTVRGVIELVSANQRSLAVSFEAIVGGHVGMMPLYKEDDASPYRSIVTSVAVTVVHGYVSDAHTISRIAAAMQVLPAIEELPYCGDHDRLPHHPHDNCGGLRPEDWKRVPCNKCGRPVWVVPVDVPGVCSAECAAGVEGQSGIRGYVS
jgi:hypothetical protein